MLHDRVEILAVPPDTPDGTVLGPGATVVAVLAAHVGHTAVMQADDPGAAVQVKEQVRVMVDPWPFDHRAHRVRWRGTEYRPDGPAMVRRRRGEDHHLTIPVERVLA